MTTVCAYGMASRRHLLYDFYRPPVSQAPDTGLVSGQTITFAGRRGVVLGGRPGQPIQWRTSYHFYEPTQPRRSIWFEPSFLGAYRGIHQMWVWTSNEGWAHAMVAHSQLTPRRRHTLS